MNSGGHSSRNISNTYAHFVRQKPKLKRTKALLTETDVRQFRGKALKQYEDTLDAITCAYVVYYLWTHGPNFARTYGTLADGHIIVPITPEMDKRL